MYENWRLTAKIIGTITPVEMEHAMRKGQPWNIYARPRKGTRYFQSQL